MIIEEAGRRNVSGFFFFIKVALSLFYNQNLRFNAIKTQCGNENDRYG
jgi:hypothetical protein